MKTSFFTSLFICAFFLVGGTPVAQAASLAPPPDLAMQGGTSTTDNTPTFTWRPSDGATWYEVAVDNGAYLGLSNVFTYTIPSVDDGWHTFLVRAHAGNMVSEPSSLTFEVTTGTLTVPRVSPSSATEDETTRISVSPSSTGDVQWCDLYVESEYVGSMDERSTNYFILDYTFSRDGSFSVYAVCGDSQGHVGYGSSRVIDVEEGQDDTFSVPAVTPSTAILYASTTIRVEPYGNDDVTSCNLYIDGDNVGAMHEINHMVFEKSHVFTAAGSYTVYALCTSDDGDTERGTSRTITVNPSPGAQTSKGQLIKAACAAGASPTNSCRAVYFYGDDGKRHAFPNESVYYSWYTNFDQVVTVSYSFLSSLRIGDNVTYHPGTVLVQFTGSTDVYAVEKSHTLRRYTSSSLLVADYGDTWSVFLVHVPDTSYNNYRIGSVIDSTKDYNRGTAWASVDSLNDIF